MYSETIRLDPTLRRLAVTWGRVAVVLLLVDLWLAAVSGWWFLVPIWMGILALVVVVLVRTPRVRVEICRDDLLVVNQLRSHRVARASVTVVEVGRSRLPTHRRTIFVRTDDGGRVRLVAATIPRDASDAQLVPYHAQLEAWHHGGSRPPTGP